MTAESKIFDERSRKMYSTILQRLQEPGRQTAIATAMGVAESTVSRLKSEHLDNLCALLVHAGLKVVPVEAKCVSPAKINALLTLAKAHLEQIDSADQLPES